MTDVNAATSSLPRAMTTGSSARKTTGDDEKRQLATMSSVCAWRDGASRADATPMKKSAVLNMHALNRVNIFKEVFLGYVNAGMLEPILAIASSEYDITGKSLAINFAQLLGLFSWLYLLSDAFDISDTQQAFVYWDRIDKGSLPSWLRRSKGTRGDIGTRIAMCNRQV